jgi:hypothetical protein
VGLLMHADVSPDITLELDGPAVKRYLNGKAGQTLLRRICDGFSVLWTGHNHIGTLNDDAQIAWLQLTDAIRERGSEWDVWSAGEWFGNASAQELGLIGLSDDQVIFLAKMHEKEGLDCEDRILGIYSYFLYLRDGLPVPPLLYASILRVMASQPEDEEVLEDEEEEDSNLEGGSLHALN